MTRRILVRQIFEVKSLPLRTTNRRYQQGFTLLELLVVLAILAGMLSLVSIRYQPDLTEQEQRRLVQQLRLFLQHQQDQAWLDGINIGVKILPDAVVLARFDAPAWQPLTVKWPIPDKVLLQLTSSPDPFLWPERAQTLLKSQDIVFSASGEYTPFELTLTGADWTAIRLQGDGVNALQIR
jgi:type II secretion system protein H